MTSRTSPLPQHTLGTIPIPAALRPVVLTDDHDLIVRALAGLKALPTERPADTPCPAVEFDGGHPVPVAPDHEVTRVLVPAESGSCTDAWKLVTLTRPRSDVAEWTPVATYGPMAIDEATELLAALKNEDGGTILEGLPAGVATPRTTAMIEALTNSFGAEYAGLIIRAIEDDNRRDHASYRAGLSAAAEVLAAMGRTHVAEMPVSHVALLLIEIRADMRSAVHAGALVRTPLDALPGQARS